jgi:hypothetical protein
MHYLAQSLVIVPACSKTVPVLRQSLMQYTSVSNPLFNLGFRIKYASVYWSSDRARANERMGALVAL